MAYEHEKSGLTILFDVIRNILILIVTGFLVFLIWKWHWIAGVLAAIPVYIAMMNLVGFLTLPLYMLTPENRLKAKGFRAFQAGDFEQGKALTHEFTETFNVNIPQDERKPATEPTESDDLWRGYRAFKRGQELYIQNDFQQALRYFDTSIDSGFEGVGVYGMRGECLQALNFDLDAIDDFTKAIKFDPEDSNNYFMRSISNGAVGNLQGRIDDLNEAIRLAGIDSASTRSHNVYARENGWKGGIAGMYRIQLIRANCNLEQQASDERRLQGPAASLGPDLVTKRQSQARRRTR